MISLIYIAPILLDLAGTEFDRAADGQSFLGILKGNTENWRDSLMCESNGLEEPKYFGRMVISDQFVYVANQNDIDELYDIYKDSHWLDNLANNKEMSVVREKMRAKLFEWLERTGDFLKID